MVGELVRVYGQCSQAEYVRPEPQAVELLADGLNNRAASLLDLAKGMTEEESRKAIDQAIELCDEACRHDPHHVRRRTTGGWRCGAVSRATDTDLLMRLEDVRKTHPSSWEASYCLGLLHLERMDGGSAAKALEEASRQGGGAEVEGLLAQARQLAEQGPRMRAHVRGAHGLL